MDDVRDMTSNAEEEGPLERTLSCGSNLGPLNKRARIEKQIDVADKVRAHHDVDFEAI